MFLFDKCRAVRYHFLMRFPLLKLPFANFVPTYDVRKTCDNACYYIIIIILTVL